MNLDTALVTAEAWTSRLESAGVAVRKDGRGRCLDNVFVERLWRSVKYRDVHQTPLALDFEAGVLLLEFIHSGIRHLVAAAQVQRLQVGQNG